MNGKFVEQLVLEGFGDGQLFDVHSVAESVRFVTKSEPDKTELRKILQDMALRNLITIFRVAGNGSDSTYRVRPALHVSC